MGLVLIEQLINLNPSDDINYFIKGYIIQLL